MQYWLVKSEPFKYSWDDLVAEKEVDLARTSGDARKTVQGLVELVHRLNIRACAEGVEDEATFRMLEAMGCDKMQGHYIGPAMSGKEFEALALDWNSRYRDAEIPKSA